VRVSILTIGTQGDVRPFVALGRGLARHGHAVRIAAGPGFKDLVTAAGLEFAPLSSDFRQLMASERRALRRALNPLAVARLVRRRLKEHIAPLVEEGQAAVRDADLVIGSGVATRLAMALAEAAGKPHVQAQLLPMSPAPDLPPVMLTPPRRKLPGPINLLLYHVLQLAAWQVMSPAINDVVRRRLGLAPYPWYGPYYGKRAAGDRVLYGYSEAVLPRPACWSADEVVTGYWFHDEARDWQPPADLARFIAAGPAPIYVGFGSMLSDDAARITREVLRAVEIAGVRAILARGWGALAGLPAGLEDRVLTIDEAPHDWLFPKVALAVHHGGAGTTAAAARAGIPSVVVPFFGDQPFWAWCLGRLGVAPPLLSPRRLTAERLAAAISAASADGMRQRARDLGSRLGREDGVAAAIETLGHWGLLSEQKLSSKAAPAPAPYFGLIKEEAAASP
jgi:UDP:flavonoid glycosyltransferase YjiC (YdhE family)